jgi:hypothetical protein
MPQLPNAIVITPFMALRPHMSCLAETHAHVRPDRTDLCVRVSLATLPLYHAMSRSGKLSLTYPFSSLSP